MCAGHSSGKESWSRLTVPCECLLNARLRTTSKVIEARPKRKRKIKYNVNASEPFCRPARAEVRLRLAAATGGVLPRGRRPTQPGGAAGPPFNLSPNCVGLVGSLGPTVCLSTLAIPVSTLPETFKAANLNQLRVFLEACLEALAIFPARKIPSAGSCALMSIKRQRKEAWCVAPLGLLLTSVTTFTF
jgi:hypothetical protein